MRKRASDSRRKVKSPRTTAFVNCAAERNHQLHVRQAHLVAHLFPHALPKLLMQIGRKENLQRIVGYISHENPDMKCVRERVGSELRLDEENDCWTAQIQLR